MEGNRIDRGATRHAATAPILEPRSCGQKVTLPEPRRKRGGTMSGLNGLTKSKAFKGRLAQALLMSTAMVSAAAFAGPVLAQTATTAAAPASTGLEEVVVTARKREENLQTTPVSASVLSARRRLEAASRQLPGFARGRSRSAGHAHRRRRRHQPHHSRRRPGQFPGQLRPQDRPLRRRRVYRAAGRQLPVLLRPLQRAASVRPAGYAVRPEHHRRRPRRDHARGPRPARTTATCSSGTATATASTRKAASICRSAIPC